MWMWWGAGRDWCGRMDPAAGRPVACWKGRPDRNTPMDARMNDLEDMTQDGTGDEAIDIAEADVAEAKLAFRWSRFAGYLGSIFVVAALAGAGVGLVYGWKPLEKRTQTVVGAKITRVEIEWPAINPLALKSVAVVKPVMDTRSMPGDVKVGDRASDKAGDKKKRGGSKPALPPLTPPTPAPVPTTWLPDQFQEQLIATAMQAVGGDPDPLSREPLDKVSAALVATGWFSGAPEVERRAEGTLHVKGTWRTPAVVLRQGGKDYLLSWDATAMPVDYKTGQGKLPAIVGVQQGPPMKGNARDYNTVWPGEEVPVAVELFKAISGEPWYGQVASVEVGKDKSKEKWRLTIVTQSGGRVVWGGRAAKPLPGEISTSAKLDRLKEINRKFGQIDARRDGKSEELEIYWERPLVLNISGSNTGPLVEKPKP